MTNNVTSESIESLEATIENAKIEAGEALRKIRDRRLYREQGFTTFEDYCRERWGWGRNYANKQIAAAEVARNLGTVVPSHITERQARELARLSPEQQREVARTVDFATSTAKDIQVAVDEIRKADTPPAPEEKSNFTLTQWRTMSAAERKALLAVRGDCYGHFNRQDGDSIGWALWSWNPLTGCQHNCLYCYARDIAERFYKQGFEPCLLPSRLEIPYHAPMPMEAGSDISYRNVFTCSMADLFGKWVPTEWIEVVLKVVADNPQWNFLFLTKFPQRMAEFEYSANAWLGTSVDSQARVRNAERAMAKVKAAVRWVSVEPMLERIHMDWSLFNWVVMGGASRSSQTPAWRPPLRWTCEITAAAKTAGCAVYHKTNLFSVSFPDRLREFPGYIPPEPVLPPEFGLVQLKAK